MSLITTSKRVFIAGLLAGATALAMPAVAQKGADPAAGVNAFYAALVDCMKGAKQLGLKGRYDKLAVVIPKSFDVPAMAKTAVGPGWDQIAAPQKAAITDAFQRFMVATYASRFDDFTGEKFEVAPAIDQPPADKLVKTQLVQSNGKIVMLNYLMRPAADGWRINDIYLDGSISELAGRRAEFSTILKSGGPDALIAALKMKGDKLMTGS